MAITLKSIGHGFAVAFTDIFHVAKGAETVIAKIEGNPALQTAAEAVAGAIGGPAAADVTRVSFAILGEVGNVLASGDAAAKAKLLDAGLDTNVITLVEQLIQSSKAQLQAAGLKVA